MSLALFAARRLLRRSLHVIDRHLSHRPTRKTRLPPAAVLVRSRRRQPSSAADADAHLPLVKSLMNIRGKNGATDYLDGTAAGEEDHHRASTPTAVAVGHRRGLRLLCVDTEGWIRIAYADNEPIGCAIVVRRWVGFLLRNPHIIPTYLLVECNCKCVTAWCKTGQWAGAFDGGGVFQWRWRWTKAKRRGQRETQRSNRGNGSGGWQQ